MPTKTELHQILAIERGVKNHTNRLVTDLYHTLQKPGQLAGISRTYQPKDDDGDRLPAESTLVQVTVPKVLAEISKQLTRLFDVVFTKDATNTVAKADILVAGTTIATDVPVSYLLFLEKNLSDLRTVINTLPVLDPSETWQYDSNSGTYRSEPAGTTRTKKVPRNHVLAPATEKHAAQVQMYHEDVVVGTWTTTKMSGAIPADLRDKLLDRLIALQEAVKYARERANSTVVTDREIGDKLFAYLLAE